MNDTQHLDLQEVAGHLSKQLDDFNRRGSGFVLEHIAKFTICITQYHPLHGSSYIPTPQWLAKKQAIVNVKTPSTLNVSSGPSWQPFIRVQIEFTATNAMKTH